MSININSNTTHDLNLFTARLIMFLHSPDHQLTPQTIMGEIGTEENNWPQSLFAVRESSHQSCPNITIITRKTGLITKSKNM